MVDQCNDINGLQYKPEKRKFAGGIVPKDQDLNNVDQSREGDKVHGQRLGN